MQKRKKILVVDDTPGIVEIVKRGLEAKDYLVTTAFDGKEAYEKACHEQPDLIVSDILMPKMDGFELLGRLKADVRTSRIPVIMLTGKGETNAILLSQDLRATDYVIKPFNVDELIEVVERHV